MGNKQSGEERGRNEKNSRRSKSVANLRSIKVLESQHDEDDRLSEQMFNPQDMPNLRRDSMVIDREEF